MTIEQERKTGLKWMLIFSVFIMWVAFIEKSQAQTWASEPAVYIKDSSDPHLVTAVQYALWSIRQRTGKSGYYAGSTTRATVSRAIVYRALPTSEVQTICGNEFGCAFWNYDAEDNFTENQVIMAAGLPTKIIRWVALHEMGHAVDANIHHSSYGVFTGLPAGYPYNYALTTADALELSYSARSLCHAELTLESDIKVPDVNGQSVMLRYEGNMVWTLASMTTNPYPQGCNIASMDSQGVITMTDVRGIGGNLTRVELAPIADNTWTLQWAE